MGVFGLSESFECCPNNRPFRRSSASRCFNVARSLMLSDSCTALHKQKPPSDIISKSKNKDLNPENSKP